MTKLTFSTNEIVSLEKNVDLSSSIVNTKPEDIDEVYEINRCVQWIQSNKFEKVCLQFPDYLLPDSTEVILKLQSTLNQTLYLLGDTAYESCCIDYIAAAHINADAIIHFGPICFSKTSANIPYIHIYEKHPLIVPDFIKYFQEQFKDQTEEIVILVDSIYLYLYEKIKNELKDLKLVKFERIDNFGVIEKDSCVLFLGKNHKKLLNIALDFNPKVLYYYDNEIKIFDSVSKIIKKRNYIIEKIKDSNTIGIVIGTLGVKNYLNVIDRLKTLIFESGKKYYLISVGKPTVAKLANFLELDIYVAVTCSMSEIYESRDFFKPIATPFDIEAALNKNPERYSDFTYDFNTFINYCEVQASAESIGDVSLLTNKMRISSTNKDLDQVDDNTAVALKSDTTVATDYSSTYLANRSWQGLEQNLGQTEVMLAKEGRSGIPLHYKDEGNK